MKPLTRENVLVSWLPVNNFAAPLLTALTERGSPLARSTGTIYLCHLDRSSPRGDEEREALDATVRQLHEALDPACPTIVPIPWTTEASPTDHGEIRRAAETALRRVRNAHPGAPIFVHLSPGTKAMHAVWLLLCSTDFVAGPVTTIETIRREDATPGQSLLRVVDVKVESWLRQYRRSRPATASADDDGQQWDPHEPCSPALRAVREQIALYAPLHVPILLLGERGSGKTTVANQIRAASGFVRDKDKTSWPSVACGQFASNPQLAQSTLFGHVEGAFTGAEKAREGLLSRADGDTLFLDEIADLDSVTRRLLMHALEGRGFYRLGDTATRLQSDFRLIAATNRSLDELRSDPSDDDFFDRIAAVTIRIPPLRECVEDLPALWARVLRKARTTARVDPPGWEHLQEHPALLQSLSAHRLPGNFRDLQHLAYHALAHLNAGASSDQAAHRTIASLDDGASDPDRPDPVELSSRLPLAGGLDAHLGDYEGSWLRAALLAAGDNKTEAARLLGLQRNTFNDRLKKLSRTQR